MGLGKERDGGILEQEDSEFTGERMCVCTSSNGHHSQQDKLQKQLVNSVIFYILAWDWTFSLEDTLCLEVTMCILQK